MKNVGGMENPEAAETGEVPYIDRKDLWNIVEIHARREPCIVDLHAFNFVFHEEPSPTVMHCLAVG